MNCLIQREERMDSEVQESSYRKKFPKGKDWVQPTPNPHGFCGLNPDSYHGMETVAIDIEKYNKLMRDFSRVVVALNQLLQENPEDSYIKTVLQDVGVHPK